MLMNLVLIKKNRVFFEPLKFNDQARPRENHPWILPFQMLRDILEMSIWMMLFCFDFNPKQERRGMRIMLVFFTIPFSGRQEKLTSSIS